MKTPHPFHTLVFIGIAMGIWHEFQSIALTSAWIFVGYHLLQRNATELTLAHLIHTIRRERKERAIEREKHLRQTSQLLRSKRPAPAPAHPRLKHFFRGGDA